MSSRKEVKRDIIVNSAFELFLEKGYMNTKIIDIADAVGIGKGTFYEYFTSKEELLLEVLSVKVITDYSYVDAIINLDISCHDKLKAFLQFQKECISKYGSNAFALQQQLLGGDPALSHEVMKAIHAVSMHLYNCIYHIICQ
ncbi:MAG: TetR/AcrR family transcriptional regulator, partial [Anaerovorax sp.]